MSMREIQLTLHYDTGGNITGLRLAPGPGRESGGNVFVTPPGSDAPPGDGSTRPRVRFDDDGRIYNIELQTADLQLPHDVIKRFRTDGGWTPNTRYRSLREITVPLRLDTDTDTATLEIAPPTHGRPLRHTTVTPYGFDPGTAPEAQMAFDSEGRLHEITFTAAEAQLPAEVLDRLRDEDG
jgi:hypothetical protein